MRSERASVRGRVIPALLALSLLGLSPALALAQVPGRVSFQGLLLDSNGAPINGVVALDFALFTAPTGGSSLWSESHPSVSVVDGVYDTELGSSEPITPELLASSTLYLEVIVDGEVLAPRRQLLAVPYAVRADTAGSAESVGGVEASIMTHIWERFDYDQNGIPNQSPLDGLDDLDGDGKSNFLDTDNDGDAIFDTTELFQGSNLNLVTPKITGLSPLSMPESASASVTINGANFTQPGLAVSFGSQSPAPTNVTPTSFDVLVGPQIGGTVPVIVSLANGESAQTTFLFVLVTPQITGLSPTSLVDSSSGTVTINGANFTEPGLAVSFGSQSPTPTNVTATSFQVLVGPQVGAGTVAVIVSLANGQSAQTTFLFRPPRAFVTSTIYTGNLGGTSGADAKCATRAAVANLGGSWRAFVEEPGSTIASRFVDQPSGWWRIDGVKVADDLADLTDGSLDAPLNRNEFGNTVGFDSWTGRGPSHCSAWTSAASGPTGTQGSPNATSSSWENVKEETCANIGRLYCFEQ